MPSSIQRNVVLLEGTAAGPGRWYRLDSKYEEAGTRAIQIFNPSGDLITIEGTTVAYDGGLLPDGTPFDPELHIAAEDIVPLDQYNTTVADVLNSGWTWIRATKVGPNYVKVQGML